MAKVKPIKDKLTRTALINETLVELERDGWMDPNDPWFDKNMVKAVMAAQERVIDRCLMPKSCREINFLGIKLYGKVRPAIKKGSKRTNPFTGEESLHPGRPKRMMVKARVLSHFQKAANNELEA